jgi:hypothetical protein
MGQYDKVWNECFLSQSEGFRVSYGQRPQRLRGSSHCSGSDVALISRTSPEAPVRSLAGNETFHAKLVSAGFF